MELDGARLSLMDPNCAREAPIEPDGTRLSLRGPDCA